MKNKRKCVKDDNARVFLGQNLGEATVGAVSPDGFIASEAKARN